MKYGVALGVLKIAALRRLLLLLAALLQLWRSREGLEGAETALRTAQTAAAFSVILSDLALSSRASASSIPRAAVHIGQNLPWLVG
jgi:hypothetical protein